MIGTRSEIADAASRAMCSTAKLSVPTGRCGPCCSVAPTGNKTSAFGAMARISSRVYSLKWIDWLVMGSSIRWVEGGRRRAEGERRRLGRSRLAPGDLSTLLGMTVFLPPFASRLPPFNAAPIDDQRGECFDERDQVDVDQDRFIDVVGA